MSRGRGHVMRVIEELVADVPPKDALTYDEIAWRVYGGVTRARVNSTARACRRLADAGAVELWRKLDWRQRGRPAIDVESMALRASLGPDGVAEAEEHGVLAPLGDEEYLTGLRKRAHAGEVSAIRELFAYEPARDTEPGGGRCAGSRRHRAP